MTESLLFVDRVNQALATVFDQHRPDLVALSDDLAPLLEQLIAFSSGGKRTRAQFVAAGGGLTAASAESGTDEALVHAGVAVELFHAAALVHDDLLDRSDTRRGRPSTHRVFETLHRERGWTGDREHFGASAAILAGDLLLMWSNDALDLARGLVGRDRAETAASEFRRMRTEVTAGQYLDVVEELAWPVVPVERWADRAIAIATSKSARYSVESPLRLGASFAGASMAELNSASAIGLPLGLAFQLRDDVLGVFGDPEVTGKPAGDDLREGKRTLLVAEVAARGDAATREFFATRLGRPDLSLDEIGRMQAALTDSGALEAVEARIQAWLDEAVAAIDATPLSSETQSSLTALAEQTAKRSS
ncbi:polyprenyl synthetase family protein [Gulosibacter sediminis]|uniref:polyprenyl synthetase family protein n=1 Tax=Gulosibacter sediminis TaxID=1729695 RepID=UPI0024A7B457|nr:polyprenyl synthetase family protein [Gulosibacter sediminis]